MTDTPTDAPEDRLADDTVDILRPRLVAVDQQFMSLGPDSDVEA